MVTRHVTHFPINQPLTTKFAEINDGAFVVVVVAVVWLDHICASRWVPLLSALSTCSCCIALHIWPTTSQDAASIPTRFQRIVIHATSQTTVAVDASSAAPSSSGSATAVATPTTPSKRKSLPLTRSIPQILPGMLCLPALPYLSFRVPWRDSTVPS